MSTDNRAAVIEDFLQEIRVINQSGVDRAALSRIVALLENLAGRRDLFNFQHFPAPVPGQGSTAFRYRLNDDGDTPTLYLNSLLPGKSTLPHNHETWAIISAVEGEEINYVYTRHDEGREPGFTTLHLEREVIVQPGTSISFLGDDLHGIKVEGEQATLHFHLYGLPLESLDRRYGVDEQGRILNYNASQMVPSIKAY
ncbi:cysteine dioxygenase [Pseudomonas deceptionensis]|uniref:Predicted metal-dependent enzyme of the double-stranded beta helix superfamily n=1 Tax=Pseudomonas deceptionensis TaxID=882211 RepID=A0A0J6GGB4_PSEDM|nr:cysteine dioxygenase [Pseudomonas deceptionensis]KMM80710.1 cysteine dioxygenase [Pseudomonas deceptionensis]SEE92378.1 Predicted metal-dependent enzyme of the double-stranded beta helix superfamily [Pseudomonas deceptionensis]